MERRDYDDKLDLIKDASLFEGITKDEIKHALGCLGAYIRKFARGEYIVLDSKNMRDVGMIISGKVQMVQGDLFGNVTVMATMGEKEVFGESFACGTSASSSVQFVALCATEVMFMPLARVLHTCKNNCMYHQRLIENMVGMMAEKNVMLMEKIDVMSKKTVRDKIWAYLTMQAAKASSPYFDVPLGRVQMGEYLCVDRSALTREMNRMKEEGLIDFDKNTFHILKERA